MQIAQVSKSDAVGGGASTVADFLFRLLPGAGVPTLHYCLYAGSGFDYYRRPIGGHANRRFMDENIRLKAQDGLAEVLPLETPFFERELDLLDIDLFHFHDLSSAVAPLTLAKLAHRVPIIWTLHDCSGFTGGCLYPMNCEKWTSAPACHDCPQHGRWPLDTAADTAWLNRQIRAMLHKSAGLTLVSPSQWLANQASMSGIVHRPVHVIPNGIPDEPFRGLNRNAARSTLGIPSTALTVCFSSGHLKDERKNIKDAVAAIRAITNPRLVVVVLGHMTDEVADLLNGIKLVAPGFVSDRTELAMYLAASDLLVFTSLAENHPLSVLEAMAAGTCVMGYATGGVPEQITDGTDGLLVPSGEQKALTRLFSDMPDRARLAEFGCAARRNFESRFTADHMIERYRALYQSEIARYREAGHA